MSRIVNSEKLSDIFDIEDFANDELCSEEELSELLGEDITSEEEEELMMNIEPTVTNDQMQVAQYQSTNELNEATKQESYVENQIEDLMNDVSEIIGHAKYLVNTSPNEDTIQASTGLFQAAAGLLREMNKKTIQDRKDVNAIELEKLRHKNRMELQEKKAQSKSLGSGNVFIDNRSQSMPFSQESIIKDLLSAKAEKENTINDEDDGIIDV